jgi:hypothetical protein
VPLARFCAAAYFVDAEHKFIRRGQPSYELVFGIDVKDKNPRRAAAVVDSSARV